MVGFRSGGGDASLSIAVLILFSLALMPQPAMAVPFIDFVNQSPADISATNLFRTTVNMTYNITDATGINASSVIMYHKTNSSDMDGFMYVNGTLELGWTAEGVFSITNVSEIWTFRCGDHFIYPGTFNYDQFEMQALTKSAYDLDEGDEYVKIQFLNVSNAKAFSFLMFYAQNQTGSSQSLRMYYCNSSYVSGNPATNNNCLNIYNLLNSEDFNATGGNSSYHVIPFAINTTSGMVGGAGGVKVTNTSYFLLRGRLGVNSWNVYYITNVSRTDAIQFTTNNGGAWSNLSGTVDAHLHQYDGSEAFWYYVCANNSGTGEGNCSEERYDLINLSGIPPSPPSVYSPAEDSAFNASVSINYTAALSPNGYDIIFYNISLYNSDETFNSTIYTNNSLNLSYLWNPAGIADGEYIIAVEACDNQSQCSTGFSGLFSIDTGAPSVSIQSPASTPIYHSVPIAINYTVSDAHPDSCWYELDGGASVPLPGCLNSSLGTGNGGHSLELFMNDTAGNVNSSSVSFTVQVPGQPGQSEPRLSAEWERACPGNGILISASGGGEPLEGVEVRLVLREPNAGEIARGITGSDGSILFNAPINGTYNAYLELSGYTYDNPLAFAYTTCAPEGAPEIPECKENADCTMSEYCGAGICVPVECACGVISSHACDAYECCSDSGCPTGFACDGNECVERSECASDADCAGGSCSGGRCAAETPEPGTGTQPSGSEPATGSQPSGTSPEVPGTQPPGTCASDGDCAPGFGCGGGSCIIIGGTPAAGADGAVSPGGVGTVQQPASGELPLPWWVIPEAMAFGAVTFAAGAYSMHWWMNRKR
jgi:hypothetical protein